MNFSSFIDAIIAVLDVVTSPQLGLMSSDAFNEPLPIIGVNVGQVLTFADKMAHIVKQLDESPVASMQRFSQQLRGLLGLPATSTLVTLSFEGNADGSQLDAVVLTFQYSLGVQASSNLYFDLAEMIGSSSGTWVWDGGMRSRIGLEE
jgi:hypothetical protein